MPGFAALNSGLFWQEHPAPLQGFTKTKEMGVVLTKRPMWSLHIPGFRCPACKVLMLDYTTVEPPTKS
jgi:hypothetical protein